MRRDNYLKNIEVSQFTDWLHKTVENSEGYSFTHSYQIETRGKNDKTIPWECNSFFDAYENYNWAYTFNDFDLKKTIKGSTFSDSEKSLSYLENMLRESIKNKDNTMCYNACCMILDWGGVLGSDTRGNKRRLMNLESNLCEYLEKTKNMFESSDISLRRQYEIKITGGDVTVVMNAGFTKIYSLLCDNFIIYDGRVGAALGLLVRKFYVQVHPNKEIPETLQFYYGKARNQKVNRNPSEGIYRFKALSSSTAVHIRNNLKANWIIQEIMNKNCGDFSRQHNPSRCIESALFMIGYKV